MAFVGKPTAAGQSPQWDGTKWVTTAISASGGGSLTTTSSWTTVYDKDLALFASQSFAVTGSGPSPVVLDGYTWYLENQSNAQAIGILPGTGLVFNLNSNTSDYEAGTRTLPILMGRVSDHYSPYSLLTDDVRFWVRVELTGATNAGNNAVWGFDKMAPYNNSRRWNFQALKGLNNTLSWYAKNRFGASQENIAGSGVGYNIGHDVVVVRKRGGRINEIWTGFYNSASNAWPAENQLQCLTVNHSQQASAWINDDGQLTSSVDVGVFLACQAGGVGTPNFKATFKNIRIDVKSENSSSALIGANLGPVNTNVVTASLTSSYSFPTQPSWSTIVNITSSWTDVMFYAHVAGIVGGANTVWLRMLIDSGSSTETTGTFGNYTTFIEMINGGSGFGGNLQGRVTGLSPGMHTFELQGVKGSGANTPTITPGSSLGIEGAQIILTNLSASGGAITGNQWIDLGNKLVTTSSVVVSGAFVEAGNYGTYNQRGSAGNAGRKYTTTDCLMNEWLDDGVSWRPVIVGVIGNEPPLTGTFVNNINIGGSVLTQYSGSFEIKGVNDTTNSFTRGYTKSFSSTTAYVEGLIMPLPDPIGSNNFPGTFIAMRESGSGKIYTFGWFVHGTSFYTYVESGVWASATSRTTNAAWPVPGGTDTVYLRIRRDASNVYAETSRNRKVWVTHETRSLTSVFTTAPDEIGVFTLGFNSVPRGYVLHFASGST